MADPNQRDVARRLRLRLVQEVGEVTAVDAAGDERMAGGRDRGRRVLRQILRTLKLGASMFLMRISVLMHSSGNAFLLGLLVAPQQVAFFVAGEKFCRPAAWLLQPINVALLPRLSHLVGQSPDQAKALAGLSILLMTMVGLGFGVAIGVAAPWLVGLFSGPDYGAAVAVMRIMALIVPLVVLNAALISQWLVPHGLDRALNVVILSATVLNLALALMIAPRFGAQGMAWVTVFVEGYVLLGLWWTLHRHGLHPIAPSLLRDGWAWVGAVRP